MSREFRRANPRGNNRTGSGPGSTAMVLGEQEGRLVFLDNTRIDDRQGAGGHARWLAGNKSSTRPIALSNERDVDDGRTERKDEQDDLAGQ